MAMPFREGEVIARKYEVIRLLGSGGMGFVVVAKHVELDEKVALKFLRTECLANQDLVARFAREARASVKIKSEHVARVFDVGTMPGGAPFIVMEYLDGQDLCDLLGEHGPLPIERATEYIMQACEALAAAHAIGIVHRDIKPENLFLTRRVQGMDLIKVLDFGISKLALTGAVFESDLPLVKTTSLLGSPVYMSPEQVRASGDIDMRTDIWSLGCVLFELLTGRPPFDARSITMLTASILEERAPRLCSRRPDAPPELESVLARCLEKDPNRRFQDVGELATALYPFAPRRARLSAERCRHVLRAAGLSQATPEIASEPPPSYSRAKAAANKTTSSRKAGFLPALRARLAFVSQHRAKAAMVLGATMLLVAAAFWLLPSHAPAHPSADPSIASDSLLPAPPAPSPGSALGTSHSLPSPTFLAVEPAATIAPPNSTPTPARSKSPASPSASASSKSSPASTPRPATSAAQELDVGF